MKPTKQPTLKPISFTTRFYIDLTNLPVAITFPYWQVLCFMEDFLQTNVFA